ncbi:MAG: hypothetical protein QMB65_07490, partial [Vicingaceae bacterium]
ASHKGLVDLVKRNMNDPDSFEHDETISTVKLNHAIVFMKYRGKNAFGGIVKATAKVKVSLEDCSIVEVLE